MPRVGVGECSVDRAGIGVHLVSEDGTDEVFAGAKATA
jgi:hypothetical protein